MKYRKNVEQRSEISVKGELTLPEGRPVDFIDFSEIKQAFGHQLLNQRPLSDPCPMFPYMAVGSIDTAV
jgi:hypothetical protein